MLFVSRSSSHIANVVSTILPALHAGDLFCSNIMHLATFYIFTFHNNNYDKLFLLLKRQCSLLFDSEGFTFNVI